ncbi:MAG: hypothetical protein OEW60_01695 [Thiovulaceae bacterium]|nr:hypothetical protein [Sulfurimonadaceae bacterium]
MKTLLAVLFIPLLLLGQTDSEHLVQDLTDEQAQYDEPLNVVSSQEQNDSNITQLPIEQDLYVTYESFPTKLYKNQIFTVSTKVVNANQEISRLVRELGAFDGIKVLQNYPDSNKSAYTTYDTYYFQAIEKRIKTPDLFYMLKRPIEQAVAPIKLSGKYLSTLALNNDDDFCQILAHDFSVKSYKTTTYDQLNNILVFTAEASYANIEDFNLTRAVQQGFESFKYMLPQSRMTYYAVIPKHLRKLEFNYFNIPARRYQRVSIPVEVYDDKVSTQMDLAPTQYTHTFAKIIIASSVALAGVILFLITRKKRFFFIIAFAPIAYIIWVYFPKQVLCIKPDANVYLLPMENGTIFNKSSHSQKLTKLGKVGSYNKVQLQNNNIGWIKDEDLCED